MLVPLERVEALEARVDELLRAQSERGVAIRAELVRLKEAEEATIEAHTAALRSINELLRLTDPGNQDDLASGRPGP